MLNEKFLEESCVICDNIYSLTETEQLGWDGFVDYSNTSQTLANGIKKKKGIVTFRMRH